MLYCEVCYKNNPMAETNTTQKLSYEELSAQNDSLKMEIERLVATINWFKRQIFSKTSEKQVSINDTNLSLFSEQEGSLSVDANIESCSNDTATSKECEVITLDRKKRGKTKELGTNIDSGLRFDDNVEIIEQEIFPDEVKSLAREDYEIVGKEISDRIVSRESRRVVLRRLFYKIKLKKSRNSSSDSQVPAIIKSQVPEQVIPRSYMSASVIVDIILDKTLYSLPLYRQHQTFQREGFYISRNVFSSVFIIACSLLSRIIEPLRLSIITSGTVAIDETPILVEVDASKHVMRKGYVWPMFGAFDEVVFYYKKTRAASVISELLGEGFKGTILSDGFAAYTSYINALNGNDKEGGVIHATCWVHARRQFVKVEDSYPEIYKQALKYIQELYRIEQSLKAKRANISEILKIRKEESLSVVDSYFSWLKSYSGNSEVGANNLLRNAFNYSMERESSMRVFLNDPHLQLDTNHLERQIRPITIGRKNWMFCWTEVGAQCLCNAQSLVRSCLLQGIDPRTYLIDVLQRLTLHLADEDDVSDLVPRMWKETYGANPIRCPGEIAIKSLSP